MRISQFQKYSQKENTVTNNVLLMLSRLNDLNVNYYKLIIERLNEDNKQQLYFPQPIFSQQVGVGNGIIDGQIEVKPSKILIETKLNHKEFQNKLLKYGAVFHKNCYNQLWHLSSKKFNENEVADINKRLKEIYPEIKIQFNNLLFADLLDNLQGIFDENFHDMELKLLHEDFNNYCYESDLISNEEFNLLFVPTGFSYNWNRKHKIYYCPINWHSQNFKYFGLYNWKSVRSISEIENIIIADFNHKTDQLIIRGNNKHTQNQIDRLHIGLTELGETQSGLKYYILPENEFYETDFKKVSHGGIQGHRYKDLRDFLEKDDIKNAQQIASKLREVTWK
jgi:hypothetical protein